MYNHKEIEKKWQDFWEKNKTFKIENDFSKPKWYSLDMFPYPSWAGLHVGHPEGFTANDILSRYKTAKWYNVLHPMWWDAFWLPAENYAIKTWTHPRITTDQNINTFKAQTKKLGFSYDWDREVDTTDPSYYKWTQWIFLKLFEHGLAYEQDLPINYCPSCKTGLANEEVLNDFTCERCGTKVEKKKIRQWVLAITKYADRLLADVDKLDWPEGIKDMQRNWIGKSEGCEFEMKKVDDELNVLILHGLWWDSQENWFPWIKKELEKNNIQVYVPDLIDSEKPDLEKHLNQLEQYKDKINEHTIIIWHSLGCLTGLSFINKYNLKIKKFISVAPVFSSIDLDQLCISSEFISNIKDIFWKYLKDSFLNYELLNKNIWEFITYISKNDPFIPFQEAKSYYKEKFKNLELREFENKWHFNRRVNMIEFPEILNDIFKYVKVYTTRIDTVFSMAFVVLAPDYNDVIKFITEEQKEACLKYIEDSKKKSDQDRTALNKEKTWVFTGSYVINPYNNEKVPLWIWDFVLWNYGTWAVFWDAHDERDFIFAKKYWILLKVSILPKNDEKEDILNFEKCFTEDWILVNSWEFTWLTSNEARQKLTEYAEQNWFGTKKVNFKLRDWLYSRQRYWGEPIPLIHLNNEDVENLPKENNGEAWVNNLNTLMIWSKEFSKIYDWLYGKIVCDYDLPLKLPDVENFEPAWDWNSPLIKVEDFVNISLANNLSWKRETNTMPQWGWSCWYYLRFMDPKNDKELVNPEVEKYWGQVDSYVWWAEHAVLHLLYARFWHKFLFDIKVVSHDEPFYRLRNQWLILAHAFQRKNWWLLANDLVEEKNGKYYEIANGEEVNRIISKMSKSLKNVINPDEIVEEFWADSLRLYEMYMAEFKDAAPWDSKNIVWVYRFLEKSERLFYSPPARGELEGGLPKFSTENDNHTMKLLHKTIKKVEEDIENYKFNTAIAALMILVNNWLPKDNKLQTEWKNVFVRLLHPFAPHLSEELWERIWEKKSVFISKWPKYDKNLIIDDTITIWVQVLWKLRWEIEIWVNEDEKIVLEKARNNENVNKWLEWKIIVKEIYVKWKIVNIVVK